MSNLVESLNSLMAALEEKKDTNLIPRLEAVDLSTPYAHLFDKNVQKLRSIKHDTLMPINKTGKDYDKIVFLSFVARKEEKIYEAAQKIADILNMLSDKEYLTGFLSTIGYLKLHSNGLYIPYAVYCFPSVTREGYEWIKANRPDINITEGKLGEEV